MRKIVFLFSLMSVFALKTFSTARLQIIHNSADAAAATVDIYVNGSIFKEDVAFRTATPFEDVTSGVALTIDITPANTSLASSVFNTTVTLTNGETYLAIANGIVSGTGYSPATPFNLFLYTLGRETSGVVNETDVLVFHGATDAPTVDVVERGVGAGLIVNDLSYGTFAGYLDLPTADFTLDVRTSNSLTTVASYSAPLATLNAGGAALVVVASGFLTPGNNNGGPAFGLYAALPSGGPLLQLPSVTASTGSAQVQVIHNSADAAANEVDIYINGSLEADDFAFRTATGFLPLPSEVDIEIAIAPASSTSVADSLKRFNYTLADGEKYIVIANGIVSPTGYSPATPFNLYVYTPARDESSDANETDVLVFHGATDAPTVDVVETLVGAGTIVDDLSYGEFEGYLELSTDDYEIQVRDETGATTVACYQAPLATLSQSGNALVVLASGFLNRANNSNGAAFGLFAASATGGALLELPACVTVNVEDLMTSNSINVYPNPVNSNTVSVTAKENIIKTVLFDLAGAEIANENHNSTKAFVNLPANISSGVYMMQVKTTSNTFTKRIVVE